MADQFDWDAEMASLDGIGAGEAAAEQPATQAMDWDKEIAGLEDLHDPATGELKSTYALGEFPESAINKSLLSAEARLKLSFADDRGKEKFLRERFEDVTKDTNGDWLIKADNKWYRADAKGLGDKDPWDLAKDVVAGKTRFGDALDEASREVIGDVADVAQEGSLIAASTLATLMTGGTSLLAQAGAALTAGAAAKGATTSLGRIMGTYEATAEEQVQDIALEGVLNAAGVGVAAGISKFGAPIAKKLGLGLAKLPKASFEMVRDRLAWMAGVPPQAVNFALTNADDVAKAAGRISTAGNTADDFVKRELISTVDEMSSQAQPVLSSAWKRISNEIAEEAGAAGQANAAKISNEVFADAVEKGFGGFFRKSGDDLVEVSTKELPELLKGLRAGRKLAKGVQFGIRSQAALAKAAQAGRDDLLEISASKDTYKAISEFYKDSWKAFSNLEAGTGPEAVKRAMTVNKVLSDRLWTLKQLGEREGISALQTFSAGLNSKVSQQTLGVMDELGVKSKFVELNGLYSSAKQEFGELIKVAQKASAGEPQALEVITNKLTSGSGKNVMTKDAQAAFLDFAKKYAPEAAPAVQQSVNKFMAYRTAHAFSPWARKGFLSTVGGVGAASGMATGNVGTVAAAAAALGASSPKTVQAMVAVQRAQQQAVKAIASTPAAMSMMKGLRIASSRVGETKAAEFFRRPELLSSFLQAVDQAPSLKAEIDSMIGRRLNQPSAGGQ